MLFVVAIIAAQSVSSYDGGTFARATFTATGNSVAIELPDAGRVGAFMCTGVTNGAPCLSNPYGLVEIHGAMASPAEPSLYKCDVELYAIRQRTAGCLAGFGNGPTSYKGWEVLWDFSVRQGGDLIFTSTATETHLRAEASRLQIQGNATSGPDVYFMSGSVRGANLPLFEFYNYNQLKVGIDGDGALSSKSARTKGRVTLDGDGKYVREVKSGSECVCSDQTDGSPVICPVAVSAAAFIGSPDHSISYVCL